MQVSLNALSTGGGTAAYQPLAVGMDPRETVHVRPEGQGSRDHVEAHAHQVGVAVVSALDQQPRNEEQVLEVLQVDDEFGVQC